MSSALPEHVRKTIEQLISREEPALAKGVALSFANELQESDPARYDLLAWVSFRCKDYRAAGDFARRTLELMPDSPDVQFNAAKCLNAAGHAADAERLLKQVLSVRPGWVDAQIDLSVSLGMQGRVRECYELLGHLEKSVSPDQPNRNVIEYNLIWYDFYQRNFREGFKRQLVARKLGFWGRSDWSFSQPRLEHPSQVRGRTLLVCSEGGAGDEMIHTRFAARLRNEGAKVYWLTSAVSQSLISRVDGIQRAVVKSDLSSLQYDYWIPAMDVPRVFGLGEQDIRSRPYLSPDPAFVDKWRQRVKLGNNLKIGIRWKGNPRYETDLMRSVPFSLLEQIARIPGVDCYSLQRDAGAEDVPASSPVIQWGPELESWEDTAAAISQLDLIVSSCTSVPHLAAGMGKPVWLLCPVLSYYLWAPPGHRTLWYDSMELFRQERLNDWNLPVSRVIERIREMIQGLEAPSVLTNKSPAQRPRSMPERWA